MEWFMVQLQRALLLPRRRPRLTMDVGYQDGTISSNMGLKYPGRRYVDGHVDIFDMVDIDLFTVVVLNMMVVQIGYTDKSEPLYYNYLRPLTSLDERLYALACEEDVRCLATIVRSFKLIEVYIEHGVTAVDSYRRSLPRVRATIEDITELGSSATIKHKSEKMLLMTWHDSSEPTKEPVCDSVAPRSLPQHDSSTPCKDSLSSVQGVDTQDHVLPTTQSQFYDINLSFVLKQATASQVIEDVMRQLSFEEAELDGEAGFGDVVGSGIDSSGLSHDESFGVDDLDLNLNEHVDLNVYQIETQSELLVSEEPYVGRYQEPIVEESSEDACTDDDDYEDDDFLVDEENEIVELDVDVHLFGISIDVPFDSICLVLNEIIDDVDVINPDGFDSDPRNDNKTSNYRRRSAKEDKDRVYLHSIESRRNLKLYKNDSVRVKEICDEKVHVFTMSQGTGPTGPNQGMEVGPSRSSGPTTRSKKRKNTCTNDDSQACSSALDAHDKGDLCPWVLKIKHCTYKFLSEKIFDQVKVNLEIPVKAVQDQLQRDLELYVSMSKAFKAKAKVEREIRGDHVLKYSMLRDYVLELQSTNPNTTVKIVVERNIDPSLPTRGTFSGQVLTVVELDSNNRIYALAYALVEAEMIDKRVSFQPLKLCSQVATMQKLVVVHLGGASGAGVADGSQGSSYIRWTKRRVQTERISPQKITPTQPACQPSTNSQVLVIETTNADGREIGDGIPRQSSAAGGASEWSFMLFQKLIGKHKSPLRWTMDMFTLLVVVVHE
ncbi:hypothetical protein Tco_0873558 [Tanacetum coccineum]|uniref:PB1-like domain-containing protein n=1 Tax=Tanacetum coccineum TaxID=301880 RepID=A0ABQ5BM16_9ASTR